MDVLHYAPQAVKDGKRRVTQMAFEGTGLATPAIHDEKFDKIKVRFSEMSQNLNILGAGIAESLKNTKTTFTCNHKLSRVCHEFYYGRYQPQWPGSTPTVMNAHGQVTQFKDIWERADVHVRSSAAMVCVRQGLDMLRHFDNHTVPDVQAKVWERDNALLDLNSYKRRIEHKMKEAKRNELQSKLNAAEERYNGLNRTVADELEKTKIAHDQLVEDAIITMMVTQNEMYRELSERMNALVNELPADKVARIQKAVNSQVLLGGAEVKQTGDGMVTAMAKVAVGMSKTSDYTETKEQAQTRLAKEKEKEDLAIRVAQKEAEVRGEAPPPPPAASPLTTAGVNPMVPGQGLFQAKALYDCDAESSADLALKVGDIITVTKTDSSGWWEGTCKGKSGQFPANYIQKL